jgi:hypothetical protein
MPYLDLLVFRWQAVFDAVGQCPVVPPTSTSARREGAHSLKSILPLAATLSQLQIPASAEQEGTYSTGSQAEEEMLWATKGSKWVEQCIRTAQYPPHLVLHEPLPRWPASLGAAATTLGAQR